MEKKNSDARIKANNRYNAKTYDQLRCNYRKDERLNDLVDFAAKKLGTSKADYIVTAVKNRLESDGIHLEDLPPIEHTSD